MPLKPIRTGINTKDTIKFTTTPTAIIFPKSITGWILLSKSDKKPTIVVKAV